MYNLKDTWGDKPKIREGEKTISIKIPLLPPILLFIVFMVLRLTNVILWSWWWVTAPLWLPIAIIVPIFLVFLLVAMIFTILS